MAETKREISGFVLSADKFASHVAALASPGCTTTHLRLFHNEPHHTAAVAQALSSNASVAILDIFELDPAAAGALAAVLSTTPRLTSLAIHHLHGQDAVSRLCTGLAVNSTLTHLDFSQLDANGVKAIANAIAAWEPRLDDAYPEAECQVQPPRLQHLRLQKCAFTPDAATALADALGRQAGALLRLELVESDLDDAAAEALLSAPGWGVFSQAEALVILDLSSCNVGVRGATRLGRFLAATSSLQTLNLSNNKAFGCAGAQALQMGLMANRTLRRLDLSSCGVGAAGVQALAEALGPIARTADSSAKGRPPLQHLVLSDNTAGGAGLLSLLQAMSGPARCTLQTLVLDHNRIRGLELAEALGVAPAQKAPSPPQQPQPDPERLPRITAPLEQLILAGNSLYDAGVAILAACLVEAPCLEQLDLRENGVSEAGLTALLPLIAPMRSGGSAGAVAGLQGLLLDGNRLHNGGAQALLEAITAAPGLWRFSVEGNKLTDPALRLSLTQLSQFRAARHSQLVVLGRQYSSSSSSEDGDGARRGSGNGRRSGDASGGAGGNGSGGAGGNGSGGAGGNASGGAGGNASGGAGCGSRGNEGGREATSPMDLDQPNGSQGPQSGSGAGGGTEGANRHNHHHHNHHHHHHHHHHHPHHEHQAPQQHKHRLDERIDGEASSGDERPALRNVAARGSQLQEYELRAATPARCGGGSAPIEMVAAAHNGRRAAAKDVPCMPQSGAESVSGGGPWRGDCAAVPYGTAASRGCSSAGGSSADGAGATSSVAATAGVMCISPPPAMCFITAMSGVGGAGTVGVSKRVSVVGESDHPSPAKMPQQLLPASRRPRYKPLTPEQQRMFADF